MLNLLKLLILSILIFEPIAMASEGIGQDNRRILTRRGALPFLTELSDSQDAVQRVLPTINLQIRSSTTHPPLSLVPFIPLPDLSNSQATRHVGLPRINLQRRIPLDQRILMTASDIRSSLEQLLDTGTTEIDYNVSASVEMLVTEIERLEFRNSCFYLNEVKTMILEGVPRHELDESDMRSLKPLIKNINFLKILINRKFEKWSY
ncbi:MAG: hypothetical protein AB8G05_17795 [Oligoflexales bacterium]